MEALKTVPALQVLSPTRYGGSAAASGRQGGHRVSFSSSAVFGGPLRKQVAQATWVRPKGGEGNQGAVAAAAAAAVDSGTLYGVLGVEVGGSPSAIKSEYKQLARRYHPDVMCPRDDHDAFKQKFIQVRHAYEVLSDPDTRADYDYVCVSLGRRSSRRTRAPDHAWRVQWQAQLSRQGRREDSSAMRPRNSNSISDSWGARMRRAKSERALEPCML